MSSLWGQVNLAKHPEKMHQLHPRKFEELVAELFRDLGYDVILTPATRDGGFDMRAIQKTNVGTALTLIECKKNRSSNPVGVSVVRGLYGVVEAEKATRGLVVTTSLFTKDARSFREKLEYRLELADYTRLVEFLQNYRVNKLQPRNKSPLA